MECNAIAQYKKNNNPYAKKVCCPNMKREAKKWAKIKYDKKTVCVKTCCNMCVKAIQSSLSNKNGKYNIKNNVLHKKDVKDGKMKPVFKCQTLKQVKENDKTAEFRN